VQKYKNYPECDKDTVEKDILNKNGCKMKKEQYTPYRYKASSISKYYYRQR